MKEPGLTISLDGPAYVERLVAEIDSFSEAIADEQWNLSIPMLSKWTLADLTRHVGSVHRWAAAILRSGEKQSLPEAPVDDVELPGWFAEGGETLVKTLSAVDPEANCWGFGIERTASFWFRRQVHETAVHRYDAQVATGTPAPIGGIFAADGVDEVLNVMVPRASKWFGQPPRLRAPITLESVDTGHRWVLESSQDTRSPLLVALNSSAETAATWAGTAEDLLLSLWGRRDPTSVLTASGDKSAAQDLWTGRLVP